MRKIIVNIADSHAGHEHGLCNPATPLRRKNDKGDWYIYYPQLNEIQKYLFWLLRQGVKAVARLARGDEIIVTHGGDPAHGNKYIDAVFEKHPANQIRMAVYNMMPFLELPNVTRIEYWTGTPAHEFGDSSATDLLAEWTHLIRPDINISYVDHGLADVDGFLIDYEHPGPPAGRRAHLKGNEAR